MSEETETIINGIDVSECEHHYTNTVNGIIYNGCAIYEQINELGYSQDTLCEQNPDCYYKQFKRLQQELDIKEKMLDKFMIGSGETLEKLQKENEKLKADLKGETEQCQKWYQSETDKHFQMLKYEQALEEIRKEYTNSIFYQCDKTEEECPCHNCIILGQLDRVQNIVKIIDEVLNDRN